MNKYDDKYARYIIEVYYVGLISKYTLTKIITIARNEGANDWADRLQSAKEES